MNTLQLINLGSKQLKYKNITSHQLDAEIILSKVLDKKREDILISLDENIISTKISEFYGLILRRALREPIAYIFNEKEFWSKNFEVTKDTLIPRPETELIIEKLVKIYRDKNISILDIGTGSGCILISLLSELKKSKGVGIDISNKALMIAKKNAKKHRVIDRVKFIKSCLENFNSKKVDLIVSNPPYIKRRTIQSLDEDVKKFEPKIALDGGNDGLDLIKKVIYKSRKILKKNGLLALEFGNEQKKQVSKILLKNNFRIEHNLRDFEDNTRCFISRLINF